MPEKSISEEISLLLAKRRKGDAESEAKLASLLNVELRRLAAHHLRKEKRGHSLQPTALVNEVYLQLLTRQATVATNRTHFFGIASHLMRQILVQSARRRLAAKRGGGEPNVQLVEEYVFAWDRPAHLVALDDALKQLEKLDSQQGQVIVLRFFGGLSVEETAELMEVSPRTVKRLWERARTWLYRELATT